jgi:electron transfer flavoprotein beta subunit
MRVAVCYKWVPDEADITIQDNHTLNLMKVKYKISDYDRNALELGAGWQENKGWELLAVSIGDQVEASLKDVLSRGPERAYYVDSSSLKEADSSLTAKVLAAILQKIGNVDLVLCGEGSSDRYSQQVGPRIAALLGYASLTYVAKVEITEEGLKVERKLDDSIEVVKIQGPAVITVLPELNKPRIPSLKQILAAKKKPAEKMSLEELGFTSTQMQSPVTVKNIRAAIMERKRIRMNDSGIELQEAAQKLIQQLRADQVIN